MTKSDFRKKGFILVYGPKGIESIMAEKALYGGRNRKQRGHISSTQGKWVAGQRLVWP